MPHYFQLDLTTNILNMDQFIISMEVWAYLRRLWRGQYTVLETGVCVLLGPVGLLIYSAK